LPNVGPYIYDVSISGFTRSSIYIYIYDISSLRVNTAVFRRTIGGIVRTFKQKSECCSSALCEVSHCCSEVPRVRCTVYSVSVIVVLCCCLLRSFSAPPRLIFLDMWHLGELSRAYRMLVGKPQGKEALW